MLQVAIGHSEDVLTEEAAIEVIQQVRDVFGERIPQAGILFAGLLFEHELILQKITEAFPGIELIGCSSDGELSSELGGQEDSVAFLALYSDVIEFRAGVGTSLSQDIRAAAHEAIEQARSRCTQEPRLGIMFPESLGSSCNDIIACVLEELGETFPLFGGTAADRWRFQRTYQFCGSKCYSDAIPILLLAGPLSFSQGCGSGWNPLGRIARVTRSEKNIVYEINGQSALSFYQSYLGRHVRPSAELPLAVLAEGSDSFYLRAPLLYDEEEESIRFAGDIPNGALVQLSTAHREQMLEATKASAEEAKTEFRGEKPSIVLLVSCVARKLLLGTRSNEEVRLFKETFPDVPVFGFHSYGEIGSFYNDERPHFHNETIISLILGTES